MPITTDDLKGLPHLVVIKTNHDLKVVEFTGKDSMEQAHEYAQNLVLSGSVDGCVTVACRVRQIYSERLTMEAEEAKFKRLQSLAHAAKQLCEWTRYNQYPEKMTSEFMHLTELIDQLDTEVRRVFPNVKVSEGSGQ